MAAWNSSSLGFSDNDNRMLKNTPTRISKQNLVEHKMFGSKRKNIQIGRKFRGTGKGIFKKSTSSKMAGDMKLSSISPSVEEFDKMMDSVVGKKPKKKMFSQKKFG